MQPAALSFKIPVTLVAKTPNLCWPKRSILPKATPVPSRAQATPFKSNLEKSSQPGADQYSLVKSLLSSSNSDMHQFYDKIELPLIVAASKEIIDYLPIAAKSRDAPYPDSIQIDMSLLTSQVRRMFQFKSIDPKSITDAQLITITHEYMCEMANQSSATRSATATVSNMENRSEDVRGTVETARKPPEGETIGIALPEIATSASVPSYLDNVTPHSTKKTANELKNDISAAVLAPLSIVIDSTSSESEVESDNAPSASLSIEFDSTWSETEVESDNEVEYIGTIRPVDAEK